MMIQHLQLMSLSGIRVLLMIIWLVISMHRSGAQEVLQSGQTN